jgi:SOS response regulatory protein OraA/RecX
MTHRKSFNYLSVKDRSQKQITAYLLKCGYNQRQIETCIDKLHEYNFLNDRAYAHNLMYKLKNKDYSLAMAEAYLKKEGIEDCSIDEVLRMLGDEYEINSLNNFLLKELKGKKINCTLINKIKNKALRNGFRDYYIDDALIEGRLKYRRKLVITYVTRLRKRGSFSRFNQL